MGLISDQGDTANFYPNGFWRYATEDDTFGPIYVRGINGFVGIEESETASSITYAKAQPLSKDIAGEVSWTNHAGAETPWFDTRYEQMDEVSVYVLAPSRASEYSGSIVVATETVILENGAVDIFSQASAAIALCILSLNLF